MGQPTILSLLRLKHPNSKSLGLVLDVLENKRDVIPESLVPMLVKYGTICEIPVVKRPEHILVDDFVVQIGDTE